MNDWANALLWRTWWRWDVDGEGWKNVAYHSFNFLEVATFACLGMLILKRYYVNRRSSLEACYGVGYLLLSLTDVREAYVMQPWLIWAKLALIVPILIWRSRVIREFYPSSRVY